MAAPAYDIRCQIYVAEYCSAVPAAGPPWVAFAAEVADDEAARRMATPLDRLDYRLHVLEWAPILSNWSTTAAPPSPGWQPAGTSSKWRINLPRAVFLDLDDTTIDDSSSVDGGWRMAVAEHTGGVGVQRLVDAVFEVRDWYWSDAERHRVGRQDLRTARTWIAEEALRRLGKGDPELARKIANRYRDIREQGQQLLPGAIEAIERLREHGIRLALLTNRSSAVQRAKIERFGLARRFDYICIEGEFGCGKPDERVYRSALQATTSQPNTAWMVGDNLEWDVTAPMRLGLTGIGRTASHVVCQIRRQ